ncbi:MAG: arabinan endo-1,5-alpha-L-arabinosidase [Acidobacteriaceae bacterium]|nr:arabinan endo-1,5-alpha-L-arabinosidase [Acidobacteriaceae bacterium]
MSGKRSYLLALFFLLSMPLFGQQPQAIPLSGDYRFTHDPSIGREAGVYYVFATGATPNGGQFAIRCSPNLTDWKLCGQVFGSIPAWIRKASPLTKDLWAPDISYFNGKFHLYYAYSTFGGNASGIALATNETLNPASPEYAWKDEGLVLQSTPSDNFNAIDPNIVLDQKGHPWLSFGSFWGGIKMRRIDATTGKLDAADSVLYSLAARARPADAAPAKPGLPPDWQAVEAPFIVRHGEFYYLFVSFDLCCRGADSTYRTMVGRATRVTGPYLDAQGKPMLQGGGTELLTGNNRWRGPGGESVLLRPEGDILVFHAYDATNGQPALQISTLVWKDGWPTAALGTK